jgi:small subunit ribosomal protein S4
MATFLCLFAKTCTGKVHQLKQWSSLKMARYSGPKGRVNRRLQSLIYETSGAAKALEKRGNQPPGMHTRFRRPSNYGMALMEKQKIKHYYGLGERQLRRYFGKATRQKGNTGENLLLLCEQRLDNVIRRVGLAKTRSQARQGVAHGHFRVNGIKVDRPSYLLRPGDIITVRPRQNILKMYQAIREQGVEGEGCEWVSFDSDTLTANVQGMPSGSDISLPVDANTVVEFLSR